MSRASANLLAGSHAPDGGPATTRSPRCYNGVVITEPPGLSGPSGPSGPSDPTFPAAAGLADLRRGYADRGLSESELAPDPFTQFGNWLADAVAAGLTEPNAMVLATADPGGQPSARTVLLKGLDEHGFVFFTNRGSRKGREVAANPLASLVFPWYDLERQVVVVGDVEPVDPPVTQAYFATRPRGSQLGAWASEQSTVISGRPELQRRLAAVQDRFGTDQPIPPPPRWAGFRVRPQTVEFWQGRPSRLHDRLRYRRHEERWLVERLAP